MTEKRRSARPEILYRDRTLVAIAKPAGLLSVPAPGRPGEPDALGRTRALLRELGEPETLWAVHRLDEATTGVLLFARDRAAYRMLSEAFAGHRIERIYHGVVLGTPSPRSSRLVGRIDESADPVRLVARGGRPASLAYAVLATMQGTSFVAFRLETGRRNQIRAQMAAIGHPIAGDRKYGRRHPRYPRLRATRPLLHATYLELPHPGTGKSLRLIAPFPEDLVAAVGGEACAQALAALTGDAPGTATRPPAS